MGGEATVRWCDLQSPCYSWPCLSLWFSILAYPWVSSAEWVQKKHPSSFLSSCTVYINFNFIAHPGYTEEEIYIDARFNGLSSRPHCGSRHHVAVKSCCSWMMLDRLGCRGSGSSGTVMGHWKINPGSVRADSNLLLVCMCRKCGSFWSHST